MSVSQDFLDWLRDLLADQGFTFVVVLGAGWQRAGVRLQVTARPVRDGLELTADEPDEVAAVLEPHVEVTRSGDRIHVRVR